MTRRTCRLFRPLRFSHPVVWAAWIIGLVWWGVEEGNGAPPTLTKVEPLSVQSGGTTTLTLTGAELANAELLLPFPATVRPAAEPGGAVRFEVTVPGDCPPGIHTLRVVTPEGVSAPLAIAVDSLAPRMLAERLERADGVAGYALTGAASGAQIARVRWAGNEGERLVAEVESRRLGFALKPVVRLLDWRGRQVAWSGGQSPLGGDARLDTRLPATGEYVIEVHDALYRGQGPGLFRLKLGDFDYADIAYPLGVEGGAQSSLAAAAGSLPNDFHWTLSETRANLGRLGPAPPQPLPGRLVVGPGPLVTVSGHAELVEEGIAAGDDGVRPLPALPIAVSGRLAEPSETDVYRIPVEPKTKLRIDVLAHRAGSPLDAVLLVRNAQGGQLARADDGAGTTDPTLEFVVPDGQQELQLAVQDLTGRHGADCVYRLEVTTSGQPDFALSIERSEWRTSSGGGLVAPVAIERRGYNGPLELEVTGLPAGARVEGSMVPEGADRALLVLFGADPAAAMVRVVGRATVDGVELVRRAEAPANPLTTAQPWLRSELALAVGPAAPIGVDWPGELASLPLGGSLPLSVQVSRATGVSGPVRVRLATSQTMPRRTIKANDGKETQEDDLARALRLRETPVLVGETTEAALELLVPGDLPRRPWSLALVAELLSDDQQNVLATVATPVRIASAEVPFTLEVTPPESARALAGEGTAESITGKIVRRAGAPGPIRVTLDKLPPGVLPPTIVLSADQTDFTLPLRLPAFTMAGKHAETRLLAAAGEGRREVRTEGVPLPLEVVAGEPAPKSPTHFVFDDQEDFPGLLTEGAGAATLEKGDKLVGAASLKVTPDHKSRPDLPGLGLRIREQPGEGEFRYLRFAWKKKGGESIGLQLHHDGQWGPGGMGRPGASFRYHAGPGPESLGAAWVVDERLPGEFVVVTRDLFADFGEFTLTGVGFLAIDGEAALFDNLVLARRLEDFAP